MNFVFAVPLHVGALFSSLFEFIHTKFPFPFRVGTLFSSFFEFIHTKFSFKSGFQSLSAGILLRVKYVLSICRDFDGNVNTRICFI